MDLRQLLFGFAVGVGAMCIYAGGRLAGIEAGKTKGGARHPSSPDGPSSGVTDIAAFIVIGAALILFGVISFRASMREREARIFPTRVLDLNAPPAAIERGDAEQPSAASPQSAPAAARPERADHRRASATRRPPP